jgi:hypothetical protein
MEPPTTQPRLPQHLEALARANKVRLARADLKRAIAAGKRSVVDVVVTVPWETATMTLAELLSSQHRWGRTRSRKFLSSIGLTENKKLGTLTPRQRKLIAEALVYRTQPDDE